MNRVGRTIVENSLSDGVWWDGVGQALSSSNLPVVPILFAAGTLHSIIGAIAAIIAKNKGHDFRFWLPLSLIAGTPALIAAWRLEEKSKPD